MQKRLPMIAAMLASAAIAVVAVLLITGGGGDDDSGDKAENTSAALPAALKEGQRLVGPNGSFELRYPKTWKKVEPQDLGLEQGVPLAAIKRSDGGGFLAVQEQQGKLEDSTKQISQDLTKRLEKQIKDFKFVRSDEVKLPAGDALSYTFIRSRTGQVQNLVVLPKADVTYTLNSIVAGKAEKAATEVGQMVRSFDPEKK